MNRVRKMYCVVLTSDVSVMRYLDFMPRLPQQPDQKCGGTIVIQVEPHYFLRRAISWAVKSLGWGWYL